MASQDTLVTREDRECVEQPVQCVAGPCRGEHGTPLGDEDRPSLDELDTARSAFVEAACGALG